MRNRRQGIHALSATVPATALLFAGRGRKANRQGSANSSEVGQVESANEARETHAYQSEEADSNDLRHFKDVMGHDVSVKKDFTKAVVPLTDAQSYSYMIMPEKFVSVWQRPKTEGYVPSVCVNLPAIGKSKMSDQKAALLSHQPEAILYMSNGNERETGAGAMADKLQADLDVSAIETDPSSAEQGSVFRMLDDFLGKRERDEEFTTYMDDVHRHVAAVVEKEEKEEEKLTCFRGSIENEVLLKSVKTSGAINLLADNVVEMWGTKAQQRSGSMTFEAADVKQLNPDVTLTDTTNFLNQMNSDSSWREILAIGNTQVYLTSS